MGTWLEHATATDIVLILTCIFTGVVTVINAFKGRSNSNKLDVIHKQTNGNLSELNSKLADAVNQNALIARSNERLQRIVQELANEAPSGSLVKVKSRVDDVMNLSGRQNRG
jgi:hypothetical protein